MDSLFSIVIPFAIGNKCALTTVQAKSVSNLMPSTANLMYTARKYANTSGVMKLRYA